MGTLRRRAPSAPGTRCDITFSTLSANLAVVLALAVVYRLLRPHWRRGGPFVPVLEGLVFGVFAVASMANPITVSPGVIFDGRTVLVSVGGLLGGPVVALVSAVVAASYRLAAGGVGAASGVAVIASAAAIGAFFHRLRRRGLFEAEPLPLVGFAIIVHVVMLVFILTLPGDLALDVLPRVAAPVLVLCPLATVLLTRLLLTIEVERDALARARSGFALLDHVFEVASSGLAITDPAGTLVRVNRRFAEIVGRSPESLVGLRGHELMHVDDAGADVSMRARLTGGETARERAVRRYVRPDGCAVWVELGAAVVSDAGGRPQHIVSVVDCIDDERRDRAEIARLVAAVEQIEEAVLITDPGGVIEFANAAFTELTGWAMEDVVGQTPRLLRHEKTAAAVHAELWRTITAGATWRGRMTNRTKDDGEFVADLTVSPVLDDTGRIVNFVGVQRDISSRLRLEEELLQAQKMEAVGRLAGGVAHDFNNLLTVITGYTELALKGTAPSGRRRGQLEEIRKAADQAAGLTRQLLTFSRKRPAELKPVDVGQTMVGVQKMLRRLVGEDVRVELDCDPDLPSVLADEGRIEQVLMNLAVNARDALPHGGRLSLTGRSGTRGGVARRPAIVIEVEDDGVGMPEETRRRVFEPFFTTRENGTGLGLSTVYGIVTELGGTVEVTSELDRGTRFRIELPALGEAPSPPSENGRETPAREGRGRAVLVAEDDDGVRQIVVDVLESAGYLVLASPDGASALAAAQRHTGRIDVLLTDVVMPGMDGRELARRLRNTMRGIAVVYMSGYTFDVTRRCGLPSDAPIVEKPLTRESILGAVREALGRSPARRPALPRA